MKFVKRGVLPVQKFESSEKPTIAKRHGSLLPDSIRCIICGPSNCGKTNSMMTLLTHENGLRFANLYVYSKSLYQPKYRLLEKVMKRIKEMGYFPYAANETIIEPERARPNSIFVFDDVACDKQDCIRNFFCMGRHKGVDCFYLCQTYTRIPKHLIRDNANLIVLFKQDDVNLKHIYDEHVGTDMTFDRFKSVCAACWKDKHGFMVISKDDDNHCGRYRKGFDHFLANK